MNRSLDTVVDRRTFIGVFAGGVLAAPFAAFAQQPAKIARIGVLGNEDSPNWEGFRQGLRDVGYVDGRNVAMQWRWAEGKADRFPDFARELVQLNVDVIVTSSPQATRAAMQATTAIPIVMANSAYPDKSGLVASLARPGGNVTGLSNVKPELMGKRLQLLKDIVPKASRLAVLCNPSSPVEALALQELVAMAAGTGMEIRPIDMRTPDAMAAAFAAVTASRADALYAFGNPVNFRLRQGIADFASKSRLPGIYEERLFVVAGGLLSYAPSFTDLYRRAATYVDRILKGAKPADLPIEQPATFELVINVKTAKALGITLPPPVLLSANELIQ